MPEKEHVAVVNIEFKKSPTYSIVPATDIWGTRTTDGHILCNFLVESEKTPESMALGISETGQAVSEIDRAFEKNKQGFIKEFTVGVMMSPQSARAIGKFLMNFADEMQPNPNVYIATVEDKGEE